MRPSANQILGSLLVASLAAGQAHAEAFTIDFDAFAAPAAFPGGNEDGFVMTVSGDPLVAEIDNGDYFSGVTIGNASDGDESILTIRRIDGGDFEFASVGMRQLGAGIQALRVEGFNDGQSVGVEQLNIPSVLYGTATIASANGDLLATTIDELRIRIRNGALGRMFIDRLKVMPIVESPPDARFWSIDARTMGLYDVDLASRTATLITIAGSESGNIPLPGGCATLNNSVYATNSGLSQNVGLHRVDVEDGGNDFLSHQPAQADNPDALTADPVTGAVIGIGPSSDTLYVTRIHEGKTDPTSSGVLTDNLGSDFGTATGAAIDPGAGTVYFTTEGTPTDTVHLWSFDVDDAGDPGLTPTFVGDTGIFSWRVLGGQGADAQVGLAFDAASGTLAMSSAEGPTARLYILDTATAEPSFVFSTPDRLGLDSLSPQDVGYEVFAESAGDIPVALTSNPDAGFLYAATDAGTLTRVAGGDLLFTSFFPGGFDEGGTDAEFASTEDTGAPDAVFGVDDGGAMNIVPLGGPPLSVPLAPQGITTGSEVGLARRGDDLYFTSGLGVPGALYRFDPNTGAATLFSTSIENDASSLEYHEPTDTFYYMRGCVDIPTCDGVTVYAYDPASDVSTPVGTVPIGSATPNFAIDPEGLFAYVGEDDRISATSLDPNDSAGFVYADNLPMNRTGQQDLHFAPSSSGFGTSLYVTANGKRNHGAPRVLEFGGFPAIPGTPCPGDVDSDDDTDVFDFAELAANFGAGPGATRAMGDVTDDGFVDVFDFAELAGGFGCGTN